MATEHISERVRRGEIVCKTCGEVAVEPVIGWSFMVRSGDSYCPAHTPLGAELDFSAPDEKGQ